MLLSRFGFGLGLSEKLDLRNELYFKIYCIG